MFPAGKRELIDTNEEKNREMEWCAVFNDVWKEERYIRRMVEMIFVFLIFMILAFSVSESDRKGASVSTAENAEYESEKIKGNLSAGLYGVGLAENADMTRYLEALSDIVDSEKTPDMTQMKIQAEESEIIRPEVSIVQPERQMEEMISEKNEIQPEEMVSEKPATKPEVIVPENPDTQPEEMIPEQPEGEVDNSISDQPQELPGGGDSSDGTENAAEGFLINEQGMIYGICEGAQVVVDECLELPASGCCGISAGAFAGGPSGIREIYIPSNITCIEEGAFLGLTEMEWFEMEASGGYYTEDGVLFSENGNCILGFPAARQGTYRVPSQVTRFAAYAFSGAKVETVDAVKAELNDIGNFPGSITLLRGETQEES